MKIRNKMRFLDFSPFTALTGPSNSKLHPRIQCQSPNLSRLVSSAQGKSSLKWKPSTAIRCCQLHFFPTETWQVRKQHLDLVLLHCCVRGFFNIYDLGWFTSSGLYTTTLACHLVVVTGRQLLRIAVKKLPSRWFTSLNKTTYRSESGAHVFFPLLPEWKLFSNPARSVKILLIFNHSQFNPTVMGMTPFWGWHECSTAV